LRRLKLRGLELRFAGSGCDDTGYIEWRFLEPGIPEQQ